MHLAGNRSRMVSTIYFNGEKLKTELEDTSLNSNKIHGGGAFILGQDQVRNVYQLGFNI